jgi:hypothetical protein
MQLPTDTAPTDASQRPSESLGARLRHERERRKISIASIAESTKILGALLEGLENNDVSRWPTGFYRRAFIRAYAVAIGLDPAPVMKEFAERFPDPEETVIMPPLAPAKPGGTASLASARAFRVSVVADRTTFSRGTLLQRLRERCTAIALDAFVLGATAFAMFLAVGGDLWAPLAVVVVAYYFVSILVLGNTPGVALFAPRESVD